MRGGRARKLFVLFLMLAAAAVAAGIDRKPIHFNIGYVLEKAPQYQIAELKIAYARLIHRFGTCDNIDINVTYYDSADRAMEDFISGKIQSMSGTSYLWAKKYRQILAHSSLFYIAQKGKRPYQRYLLLAAPHPAPREGKRRMLLPRGDYNARLFLEHDTLERYRTLPRERYRIAFTKKTSIAIYHLFFGKADFAVVPEEAWETAMEMNPKIGKKIRVVRTSPRIFFYAAGCYSDRLTALEKERVRQANASLKNSVLGRQLLTMIQIRGYNYTTGESFGPFIRYVESTERLRKERLGETR